MPAKRGNNRRGCLGQLLGLFGAAPAEPPKSISSAQPMPRVMVSNRFISPAEASFFHVLNSVVAGRGHVLAQVSLGQLLFISGSEKTNPGRNAWRNRIAQKSLDFLVIDAATFRPLVALELDDSTHARDDRRDRDDHVDDVLQAAGLPLVRIRAARGYDTGDLNARLQPHLSPPG